MASHRGQMSPPSSLENGLTYFSQVAPVCASSPHQDRAQGRRCRVEPVVGNPLVGVDVAGIGPRVDDAIARDGAPIATGQEPANLVEPSGRDIFRGWPSPRL